MLKKLQDYLPEIEKMFPTIPKQDIRRCVNYGWQMFYYYNLSGCDVIAIDQSKDLWFYCGNLYDNSIKYFDYYRKKLQRKLRLLHHRKRIPWDGYYYTAVNKQNLRKIGNYELKNQTIFRLLEEAKLYYNNGKYFIRFKYPENVGYSRFKTKYTARNAEVVYTREKPLTFKDILYYNNDYKK